MADPANPFSDPLRYERRVPDCAMVIFGASGDLSRRKLLPALYRLAYDRRLPASFTILGTSRKEMSDDEFRKQMRDAVEQFSDSAPFDQGLWARFSANIYYVSGDLNDPRLYSELAQKITEIGQKNVLFYLAVQPSYYATVVDSLGKVKLEESNDGWRRIIIEKPFGHDLKSVRN
jgi:glucose-6-phosphate 1-dehydrogenase